MTQIARIGSTRILYAPDRMASPRLEWFDPSYWLAGERVLARFGGRGTAIAIDAPFGPAVLRVFQRGGLIRHLVRSNYFYLGFERSRGVREFRLLARLHALGLPVPLPLAAACTRQIGSYRAALFTRLIAHARSLSQISAETGLSASQWYRLGQCLARFFDAGVVHPDLNAHNVLMDDAGNFWLVDFDRARLVAGRVEGRRQIARLARSMRKLGYGDPPAALQHGLCAGSGQLPARTASQ